MQTIATKFYKNGQSQMVRLPKPFQFVGTDEVVICRQGNAIIITPKFKPGHRLLIWIRPTRFHSYGRYC